MAAKKSHQSKPAHTPSALAEWLALPINNLYTRKILEILQPLQFYLELDQWNAWHLFGEPGVQGHAHFQVGIVQPGYWDPASDQSAMQWQSRRESGAILHLIHRQNGLWETPYNIALVHHPHHTKQTPILGVKITPLWDQPISGDLRAGSTYPMYLRTPCGCNYYQRYLRTHTGKAQ